MIIQFIETAPVVRHAEPEHSLTAVLEPDGTLYVATATHDPEALAQLLRELAHAIYEWPDLVDRIAGLTESGR